MLGVADDPDHLDPFARRSVGDAGRRAVGDPLPDRVGVGPVAVRQLLVHHRDLGRAGPVLPAEHAPSPQRNPERVEEPRAHDPDVTPRTGLPAGRLIAFHLEARGGPVAAERHHRRAPDRSHARGGRERRQHLVEEGDPLRVRRVARRGKREVEGQDPVGVEPGVHALQPGEALHQQAGAGQERQRQCDLRDHQHATQALAPAVARAAAPAFLEHAVQIDRRGVHRRRQPEQQSGQQRYDQREHHDRRIDPDLIRPGEIARVERGHRPDAPEGQPQAQHAAGEREQQALGQELAHESLPAGSQRGAHRDLLRPRGRAGEQQVGDVGAGDQQHEPHRTQEHQQGRPDRSGRAVAQRCGEQAPIRGVGIGVLGLELLGQGADLRRRLLHGHADPQPGDEVEALVRPLAVGELIGLEHDRRPQLDGPVEHVAEAPQA